MENEQEYYDEDFIIKLTIDNTDIEEAEIIVTDPTRPIRKQIKSIVKAFELPIEDEGGNLVRYMMGKIENNEETFFEYEDAYGREMSLVDYNIQPGDKLRLVSLPLAGGGCLSKLKVYDKTLRVSTVLDNEMRRHGYRHVFSNSFWSIYAIPKGVYVEDVFGWADQVSREDDKYYAYVMVYLTNDKSWTWNGHIEHMESSHKLDDYSCNDDEYYIMGSDYLRSKWKLTMRERFSKVYYKLINAIQNILEKIK